MNTTEQQFLNDLDKKMWNAADRLRSSLDAAVYKHVVLGLIFLKYTSDAFEDRRQELERKFRDLGDEYYMSPTDYGLTLEEDIETERFMQLRIDPDGEGVSNCIVLKNALNLILRQGRTVR